MGAAPVAYSYADADICGEMAWPEKTEAPAHCCTGASDVDDINVIEMAQPVDFVPIWDFPFRIYRLRVKEKTPERRFQRQGPCCWSPDISATGCVGRSAVATADAMAWNVALGAAVSPCPARGLITDQRLSSMGRC